jgi:twitching motility protein PilT
VLVPKIGGGRVAAREVLLNSSTVASLIAEGQTSQLPMAIEGGHHHGMQLLAESLTGLVRGGIVEAREALRRSGDRPALLAMLEREGIDTSSIQRRA